jgi:stage V sporulation protein K
MKAGVYMGIRVRFSSDGVKERGDWAEKTMRRSFAPPLCAKYKTAPVENVFGGKNNSERSAHEELGALIGLDKVKAFVYEIIAFTEIKKQRLKEGLSVEPTVLHAVFKGPPGSGKTTVARLLASLYRERGILAKGHLIEAERADLVGEYIGHTARKTRELIKKSLGGVLFIDEAYSLCCGGEKDFGHEAINTLIKAMEDYKDEFILIIAGYDDEMDRFMNSNPGLNARFPLQITFCDYSVKELLSIARLMYAQKEYSPNEDATEKLEKYLWRAIYEKPQNHGNARMVRNIVEASLRCQAVRLYGNKGGAYDAAVLCAITSADMESAILKSLSVTNCVI